jgi:hypothetical protein
MERYSPSVLPYFLQSNCDINIRTPHVSLTAISCVGFQRRLLWFMFEEFEFTNGCCSHRAVYSMLSRFLTCPDLSLHRHCPLPEPTFLVSGEIPFHACRMAVGIPSTAWSGEICSGIRRGGNCENRTHSKASSLRSSDVVEASRLWAHHAIH